MLWVSLLREAFWILKQGIKTDLWGLRCPLHCGQTDWPLLCLVFLLGLLCGSALVHFGASAIARHAHSAPSGSAPDGPPRSSPASRRLALYEQPRSRLSITRTRTHASASSAKPAALPSGVSSSPSATASAPLPHHSSPCRRFATSTRAAGECLSSATPATLHGFPSGTEGRIYLKAAEILNCAANP